MAKKNITITLYMSEMFYPVQNKTYITGRSRSNGTNHEEVANMQANEDDENANQILDSIGNAFATLKTKLSEYLVEDGTTADNILLDKDTNLQLVLTMPSNYNQANNGTLARAAHQYIVNTAIGDWFTMTNKNDAADYVTLAAGNLEQIREAASKRVRPQREAPATEQPAPATEQPAPATEQPAPATEQPAPTTEGDNTPTTENP